MENESKLILRDLLAIDRTKMANERTFLAYFRTAIVLFGTGVGILKIELLAEMRVFGIALLIIAPFILLIGIIRLIKVRKLIKKYYTELP